MPAVLEKTEVMTLEDMVNRLGSIPLSRIRACPPPGTAVEQDVIDLNDRENRLFELVEGVLVEKPMGFQESRIAATIITELEIFMREERLGIVVGEAGMMRLTTGLVRIPDVSAILWERLPGQKVPKEPIPSLAPDIAVEVLSKSNTVAEIDRKISEYFAAGSQYVWIVDPEALSVRVYNSPSSSEFLSGEDIVSADAVLPGFHITVSEIFERSGIS